MKSHTLRTFIVFSAALCAFRAAAAPAHISVRIDEPGHTVSPMLWGAFFEDINLSADGGLYPELVRNRSFEGSDELNYWKFATASKDADTAWSLDDSRPLNLYNRHSLRLETADGCSLENEGYWGINYVAGNAYRFKVAARGGNDFQGALRVELRDASGTVIGSGEISGIGPDWEYHSLTLTPSQSDPKGKLRLEIVGSGAVYLDMISLMPEKTWKGHGMRPDLAEAVAELKPSFFRFPGGCWVEGDDMAHAYQWKETIGDIDVRTPLYNVWGYNATHGIGYHEYLQMAEDLDAEPIFCINVGMSHTESVPMDRMGTYVQDALDAIEYANGPVDSVWGSLRARNGHPAPFNLRYLEIGNENGGPDYAERWPLFVKAIQAKYPEMILIANYWDGDYPKKPMPEIIDQHFYESPEAFMRMSTKYDDYDRDAPGVFVGEFAATKKVGEGSLRAALGEAAFMTGLERNSDVVKMAVYAPLFVNVNHRAWNPDLINFDSSRWYGLPGYYVQQMFSLNRGDVVLPLEVSSEDVPPSDPRGRAGLGSWNAQVEYKDFKVTAPDGTLLYQSNFEEGTDGWAFYGDGEWSVQDGALRQMAVKPKVRAVVGDPSWKDYTIEVKARKLGGREGFLVLYHNQHHQDRSWWNLGGWDNTAHALDLGGRTESKDGSVETGRWYDLRVEIRGDRIRAWVDGEALFDSRMDKVTTKAIYASATKDTKSGDIILKVVNADSRTTETTIDLQGIDELPGNARASVLTSENPTDENSLEAPRKIAPETEDLTVSGTKFTRSFPANSFTVLRIATKQ